jgi:hypothetical protein
MNNDETSDAVESSGKVSHSMASCFVAMLVFSTKPYRDSVARPRTAIMLSATP